MISVIICRRDADDWLVDTWLMSCRVLGRRVEQAVLQELVSRARELGMIRIVGTYRPTERNRLVEDHYAKLGFTECECPTEGSTRWSARCGRLPGRKLADESRSARQHSAGMRRRLNWR